MGYNIKEKIEQEELLATKAEVDKLMANRSVSDLRSLPPMTDPLNILLLEVGFLIAVFNKIYFHFFIINYYLLFSFVFIISNYLHSLL